MTKRIQTIIPDVLAEQIKNRAKEESRTISNFTFKLIQKALKNEPA